MDRHIAGGLAGILARCALRTLVLLGPAVARGIARTVQPVAA
jgi:hypothetical protein